MNPMTEVIAYAESAGFVRVRQKKHMVLRLGKRIVSLSVSPSCPHAAKNARKEIDKILKESESEQPRTKERTD